MSHLGQAEKVENRKESKGPVPGEKTTLRVRGAAGNGAKTLPKRATK